MSILSTSIRSIPALIKAPLSLMAVLPGACAYILSAPVVKVPEMSLFLVGTVLTAFGSAALNQSAEGGYDAKMDRTRNRPIPKGALSPASVLAFGAALSTVGAGLLFAWFPALAGILALATVFLYWLVYTPLKRRTPWCTEVGAVPGAMPVLIGSAAASGGITPMAWVLFFILYFWQMPHFHPIAWRYRKDYRAGGFRMLVLEDGTGERAARRSVGYGLVLVLVSVVPVFLGAGPVYWAPVLLAGAVFLRFAVAFRQSADRDSRAIYLFRFSLVYLAILLVALTADHVFRMNGGLN